MTTSNAAAAAKTDDKPDFYTFNGLSMYAKVFQPSAYNEQYDIPSRWEIDVLLTESDARRAEDSGISIRNDSKNFQRFVDENGLAEKGYKGHYIKVKKPTLRKKWDADTGTSVKDSAGKPVMVPADRPRVVDSRGTEIPEEADLLIGNGSEVEVTAIITKPQVGGRDQFGRFGARLIETRILELNEYKRPAGTFTFESTQNTNTQEEGSARYENDLLEDEIPFLPDED